MARSRYKKAWGWFKFKLGFTKRHPRSHWKKSNNRVWFSHGGLRSYGKNYY